MKQTITETQTIQVNFTDKEKNAIIFGNGLFAMANGSNRFLDAIRSYENIGWTIISRDQNKLSFVIQRTYEVE